MQNYVVAGAIVLAAIIIAFTFRYDSFDTGLYLVRINRFTGSFDTCFQRPDQTFTCWQSTPKRYAPKGSD